MSNRGEGRLHRIRRSNVEPMFGGKVVEREEHLLVLRKAFDRLGGMFGAVPLFELLQGPCRVLEAWRKVHWACPEKMDGFLMQPWT